MWQYISYDLTLGPYYEELDIILFGSTWINIFVHEVYVS